MADEAAGGTLRVASFNIHHGTDERERGRLLEQGDFLRSLGADLVALQECDDTAVRSGMVDQPAHLAARALFPHRAFGQNLVLRGGGGYGCALLSRHPLLGVRNAPLPMVADAAERLHVDGKRHAPEPRGLLYGWISLGGRSVLVATTHASIWAEERVLAAARFLGLAAEHDGPVILAADLNEDADGDALRMLAGTLTDAMASASVPTFPASAPAARIDHILVRGFEVLDAAVVPTDVSDHHAVMATLRIAP